MVAWSIALVIAAILLMPILLHPLYIFRGLSREEQTRKWPGDDVVPGALPSGSRGITVQAPVDSVWPWITQIGQDRAGFYSYRWLENIVGAKMPDVRHVVPEWGTREPGQDLIMAPTDRFGPIAKMELVMSDPGRALVYKNAEGAWGFHLEKIGDEQCRLVARGTWKPAASAFARALHFVIFDPVHYLMEWKMLCTIKKLSEAAYRNG